MRPNEHMSDAAPLPAVFVSHGAPDLLLSDVPANAFLRSFGAQFDRPRAIVVASAHWETREPAVDMSRQPETIHDFSGFPAELQRVVYPASGDPALAREIADALREHGLVPRLDQRGLDHGAWVPLALAYPEADVPVLQVALQTHLGAEHHLRLGRALAPFRRRGVLVLGSGSATHNLRALSLGEFVPAWATAFDDWLAAAVERGDVESLVDYRARAPHAARNHPTEEHFFPLLVALGAAGEGARGRTLHRSFTYGSLSMSAFAFE